MEAFDKGKVVQLIIGIVGIYFIYSITGLLQESVYLFSHSASPASISTTVLERRKC